MIPDSLLFIKTLKDPGSAGDIMTGSVTREDFTVGVKALSMLIATFNSILNHPKTFTKSCLYSERSL